MEFKTAGRLWSGRGCLRKLPDALAMLGVKRLFVVADRGLRGLRPGELLESTLAGLPAEVELRFEAEPEPTTPLADRLAASVREFGADGVLGFGGGSAMDLAKAAAVLARNPGPAASYQGFELLKSPGLPKIMVPTTAGTGAETTQSAVLHDPASGRKGGINGRWVMPEAAFLDADLLDGIPLSAAGPSAMDAVAHAVESLTAKNATRHSLRFSRAALEAILPALRPALLDREPEAAEELLFGAYLAGVAIANSETGGSHALAYPLGVRWKVPHGTATGSLLPHVIRHNLASAEPSYAEVSRLLFGNARARELPERLEKLGRELTLKNRLSDWGIGPADLDLLAREGVKLPGPVANNPAPLTAADARRIYAAAL